MGFCVKCGKKGIEGSLCEKCKLEVHPLLKEFKDINIEICPLCKAYKLHHRWNDSRSFTNSIRTVARESIQIRKGAKARINPIIKEFDIKADEGVKKQIDVEVKENSEIFIVPVKVLFTVCGKCSKQRSSYFEAILQLRNPKKEIIRFVYDRMEQWKKHGVFITAEKDVPKGIDFYMTSNKYATVLGNLLQKRFNGILKISSKLFSRSRQTSKNIYRVNVLFKVLDFKPGDIVTIGEKQVKVLGIRGERVQGMTVDKKKKIFIDPDQVIKK